MGRYLLDPSLPPPGALEPLLDTGKVRYADAPDAFPPEARILHSLGPLDGEVALADLWPVGALRARLVRSATIYDFIPALDPDHELAEPGARSRYRVRLELVRSARLLLALSGEVARQSAQVLGPGRRDVVVVGAAPSPRFAPAPDKDAARARAIELVPGLDRPYVLCPAGSHPRKNNERVVRAFTRLAAPIRDSYRLVLTGAVPESTSHHYSHLAEQGGAPGSVVTAGFVDDDTMVALYQGADLVCFASLAEGFGLPVAEALACATPVVASDIAPLDELLDEAHRFAPTDEASIARAIEQHLGGATVSARSAPTWEEVASRSASAFDSLSSGLDCGVPFRRRPRRASKTTVAFVTPLPPAPTGVATYSYRLIEELCATGAVDLDAFVDGPTEAQRAPEGVPTYDVSSLPLADLARGVYDAVVYSVGNSHHHLGALWSLRRRAGTVVSHDVRLTNLYRHEHGDPALPPGGLERAIRDMYGPGLPDGLGGDGSLSDGELERYGLLMCREVVACSERFLVSSHGAARLAGVDAGTELSFRIGVLPFACEPAGRAPGFALDRSGPPESVPDEVRATWGAGPAILARQVPVLAHFGIVDPTKEPATLVDALALAAPLVPGLRLALVGPIADALAVELATRAKRAGVADALVLTGPLDPDTYREWTERATVAVQLRRISNGEASAAIGECLASGVPTVVTDLGWCRELPDGVVARVPARCDAETLAGLLVELVRDEPRRAALAAAGRAEAGRRSFARTAVALLELVHESRSSREPRRSLPLRDEVAGP